MIVKRNVFRQIGEKLFSVTAFKQKEFGKGDKKGKAKKAAAKRDRQIAAQRKEVELAKQAKAQNLPVVKSEVQKQAQNIVKQEGAKNVIKTTAPVPKAAPKPHTVSQNVPAKVQAQIQAQAKANLPVKAQPSVVGETVNAVKNEATKAVKKPGIIKKAATAIKGNKKLQAAVGAGTVLAGAGTAYAIKRKKKEEEKSYSKLQDEDYLNEQKDKKESVKHAKGAGTIVGGGAGAALGHVAGKALSSNKKAGAVGAVVGAVGGAVVGRKAGKVIKKSVEDEADRKINRYKKASEKDKKYIREKEEKEKDREVQKRQARAQEQMAWNSWK